MTNISDRLRQGGATVRSVLGAGRDVATRRPARIIGILLFGAVGGLIALALTPPVEGSVGPGQVEINARSAIDGRTEIGVPPLGTISANTHRAPLLVNASVTSVNLAELQGYLVAERPTQRLIREAEEDLGALAVRFGVLSIGAGVLGGALAGVVASHLQWRRVALSSAGGLVTVSLLLGVAWRDFDAAAMAEPTFEGPIERAPNVIETISRHVDNVDNIRSRVDTLGREFAELYALSFAPAGDEAIAPATTILHVSDIHSNPLAMEVVLEIAQHFGVDAILDTGDLTSFGLPVEARIAEQIETLDVPYLFVPGNHDSEVNRTRIGQTPNVQVLRDDVAVVNDLRILGIEDPTFTATNEITPEESDNTNLEHGDEAAVLVEELMPDVLAVHNERLARESFGEVPLIVNGHGHVRGRVADQGTVRLEVGSTGAHGLESFMVDTDAPFEAQLLHFSGRCLRYRDYLLVHGIGGDIHVDRQTFRLTPEEDGGRPTCAPVDLSA